MRFIYPAIFHETEEGTFKGYFPDLECCYGEGETLDDAIDSANSAAYDWLVLEIEEGGDLPYVSDPDDLKLEEGDILRNISVNIRFNIGWDE